MNDPKAFPSEAPREGTTAGEGLIERICELLCAAAIIVMLLVIGEDIVSRGIWNTSLELSDEIGGYMLVAVAFLSLAVVKSRGAFHRTDYLQSRLPRTARIASSILFDLLALGVVLILLWQYFRYTSSRWEGGNTAPTRLATPQWIPAVPMILGMAAYCLAIVKSLIGSVRSFRSPAKGRGSGWDSE